MAIREWPCMIAVAIAASSSRDMMLVIPLPIRFTCGVLSGEAGIHLIWCLAFFMFCKAAISVSPVRQR